MLELIDNAANFFDAVFAFQRFWFDLQVDEYMEYMRGYGNLFKPFSPIHNAFKR